MRNSRIWFGILLGLLLFGLVAGVGWYAYNVGVTRGIVASGQLVAPTAEGGVVPPAAGAMRFGFPYAYGFHPPFGFGFGILGCLVPIFFFFLIFALFRLIFRPHWGGPWRRGGWDYESGDIPPRVQEWHRKMHDQDTAPAPPSTPAPSA